jgi:NNP family nitrate/nitrite transporter-like MFS transporter
MREIGLIQCVIFRSTVGSTGNFGGVMFSVAYRFTNYHKGTWIMGVCSMAIGILMTLIPPIPKSQLKAAGYMSR